MTVRTLPDDSRTPGPRTDRSWELFPHGLLVFARADAAGASRMLISHAEPCTAAACSCREVGLRAVVLDLDGDLNPAALSIEALRSMFATTDAMNAQLDIDLGSLAPDDFEGRVPLSDDWVTSAQSQIDGELLDRLHEQWLRAKGMASTPRTDWEPRDPGDLVGWNEAHPADRADLFLDGDRVFVAEELYCVNPTCTCNEAMVAFSPTTRGAPDLGSIRLRISTLDILDCNVKPDKAMLLDRLWKSFSARHRHLAERLSLRNRQMIDLASVHSQRRTPVTRSAERVGRNEPCPCRSGKKYKRCCASSAG